MKLPQLTAMLVCGLLLLPGCSEDSILTAMDSPSASLGSNIAANTPSVDDLLYLSKKSGKSKIDVCHVSGNSEKSAKSSKSKKSEKSEKSGKSAKSQKANGVQLISVSPKSLEKHLAHGDGVPGFGYTADCLPDRDGDGVDDANDAFPDDPSETTDTDGDGVGDNTDAFPNDPSRWEAGPPACPISPLDVRRVNGTGPIPEFSMTVNGITISFGPSGDGYGITASAHEWNGAQYTTRPYGTGDYYFVTEHACEIWGTNPDYWAPGVLSSDTPRDLGHSLMDAYYTVGGGQYYNQPI